METLYDLLGALPRDDAEELRVAFRRAVRRAHPDLNPGDPDAGMKFRQIVRASEILADQDQRAAYDHLLDLADQEERRLKKRAVAQTIYQVTSGVIAFSVALGALAGGYLAVMQMPGEWIPSLGQVATVFRQSTETASTTLRQSTDAAVSALRQSTEAVTSVIIPSPPAPAMASTEPKIMETKIAEAKVQAAPLPEKSNTIELPPSLPTVVTLQPGIGATPPTKIGPPLDITLLDTRAYREHGIVAYRNGDLDAAIADFDQAIQLDPKSSADIARAKRIEKTGNGKSASTSATSTAQSTTKKPRPVVHVTYWDRLGWKNPFSLDAATARQDRYGHRFGDGSYTPESNSAPPPRRTAQLDASRVEVGRGILGTSGAVACYLIDTATGACRQLSVLDAGGGGGGGGGGSE